jgi:hypothetical protein
MLKCPGAGRDDPGSVGQPGRLPGRLVQVDATGDGAGLDGVARDGAGQRIGGVAYRGFGGGRSRGQYPDNGPTCAVGAARRCPEWSSPRQLSWRAGRSCAPIPWHPAAQHPLIGRSGRSLHGGTGRPQWPGPVERPEAYPQPPPDTSGRSANRASTQSCRYEPPGQPCSHPWCSRPRYGPPRNDLAQVGVLPEVRPGWRHVPRSPTDSRKCRRHWPPNNASTPTDDAASASDESRFSPGGTGDSPTVPHPRAIASAPV